MEVKYKILESYFDSKNLNNIKKIYENTDYKQRGEYYEIIITDVLTDLEIIIDELQKKLVTAFLKTFYIGNYENNIYILILVDSSEVEEILTKIKSIFDNEHQSAVRLDNSTISTDLEDRKSQRDFILKNKTEVERLKKDILLLERYQYKVKNSIELMALLLMVRDKSIVKAEPIIINYKTYSKYYKYYQKLSQKNLQIPKYEVIYDFIPNSFENQRADISSKVKILEKIFEAEKQFSKFKKNLKLDIPIKEIVIIEKENILGYRNIPNLRR